MKHALVTGAAGFIGSHVSDSLLADGWKVTAFDNFDPFYDPAIKLKNIAPQRDFESYSLVKGDLRDFEGMRAGLGGDFDVIVHLAAKAGVRPSIDNPLVYQAVNVAGTQHLLELARVWHVKQFVFGSSSSVYGVNPRVPWSEADHILEPISPYASTKVSGELLGHVYSHLHGIRFLALRFFTVYGPRQRPDLAIHRFALNMLAGRPIQMFGDGTTRRDYTFVDDIVRGVRAAITYDASMFEVINLGNSRTVTLAEMIRGLETVLGMPALVEEVPEQAGDVPQTWADVEKAGRLLNYSPRVDYSDGIERFARWLNDVPHVPVPQSASGR